MAESATGDKKLALEWLEGELSLIYAFLGHVETLEGLGQGERSVAEEMADVARQAQQVVDTIILNSLQERRRGRVKRYTLVFKTWSDELRIARSTEMIKRQILGLFDSIERYGFGVFTDEVAVEAIPMDLNPVTGITVGSSSCTGGIRKFDEEIRYIQSYVEHMEAAGQEQIRGRAKILMEQMREIIRFADGGIDPRRRFFKMEHVGVLIEDLRERMVAYDIGDAEAIRGFGGKPKIQLGKGLGTLYAKINRIKRDLEMMKALFDDVGLEEELGVITRTWVGELKGVAQNIESVLDTYGNINPRGNDNQIFPILYNLKSRLKVEKQVNRIVRWIQILSTRRRLYRIKLINPITRRRREWHQNAPCTSLEEEASPPTYTVNLSDVIGIDESTHAVMDWILANDKYRRIVSIVGVEGTGKSTLARLVYDNETIRHHFVRRVWVDVPPGRSAGQTFQDIRTRVMWMEYESRNEIIEESMGASCSSTDRSYLLVLDGVGWTGFGQFIEDSIPDIAQGCRFILTTRRIDAAPRAGSKNLTLKLPLLTDDQSWELFISRFNIDQSWGLFTSRFNDPELMKLRKKILRSCGGLPLSILKLGRELSGEEPALKAWSTVIERFNQYQIPWLDSSVISKFPLNLRRCLQYFEKFPIEDEIPARRLIALWVAEGLVRGGRHPPEDIAKRNLTELIDRNMIQVTERKLNGEVKTCCLPVALRKLNLQEVIPRDNTFGVSHLADHLDPQDPSFNHIHVDSSNLPDSALRDKYEHTYSFVSFDTREGSDPGEEIGNFLDRCVSSGCFLLLRVLDLERVFRPKLPKELGKLILLRYLGLRWTFLETLPSNVSQLLSLQTLDIKHTYISELPSSIWKMEKLRHLYLNESYRCRFPARPSHAPLKDLQTLWGVFIDEESPVKDGLDSLTNLKKLGLASRLMSDQETEMRSRLEEVADWVKNLHKLQSLRLKSYNEAGKPWDLPLKSLSHLPDLSSMYLLGRIIGNELVPSGLPQSLTYLTLSGSGLMDDPMKTLRNLVNLRYLRLLSGSFAGKKMLCSSGGFLQLHVLKLWKLKELEELVVEEGALPKLRDLEIRSCESLKAIPIGLHKVSTLKELELSEMPIEFMNSTPRALSLCHQKDGVGYYTFSKTPALL